MSAMTIRNPERRIETNPFDVDAWNLLLREHQSRPIEQERDFYESLVKQFPNAGRYWKAYIEHELRSKNFENVEKIFARCLVSVLNIDLWKCYVHYIFETKGQLSTFREKMAQAYDFALEKVGLDLQSHVIYTEYIAFLKKVPAVGQYAENQRITAVRRVYQRAIATPLHNLDAIWNEYCVYEKTINSTLAEKLIVERSREYQQSRKVEREMENLTRGLNRQAVSVPPKGTTAELKQVELWKKYIQWEKTNPLETEEYGQFAKRVIYAYEQALLCLGYYPEIWYEAALFLQEASKSLEEKGDVKTSLILKQETIQLFERAINGLMKESKLIYFAYADFEEDRMKFENVKSIYDRLLSIEHINPTLTYIQLMRFVRRTEGAKNARLVFKRAREDARTGHQVYVASALMEYYCHKDKDVAMRIFNLGLKKYENEPEFGLAYVEFLAHLNEDNNTRVVFERILTSGNLAADKAVRIWDRYLDFESTVGDLASIVKVEKRRKKAYETAKQETDVSSAFLVIDRYRFMDLLPCSGEQLKLIGYSASKNDGSSTNGNATSSTSNSSNNHQKSQASRGPQAALAVMGGSNNVLSTNTTGSSEVARYGYPRPDISQMIPFKPRINTTASYHPVPGGVFPPPQAAAHLLQMLPPPHCFIGPFVNVDKLMASFAQMVIPNLPSTSRINEKIEKGQMMGPMLAEDVKKDMYQLLASTNDPAAIVRSSDLALLKRKRGDSDDEDENGLIRSATQDAYKRRMNKKAD
ncbi:unnamed protein product [Caenorhabditis angaria]|uniref:Suppressor of forked domain-containing protein n=1 Tax=Caenorhabditis angaria TaxID=860376 RepID=A0A9P1IB71_9PELO|nr:unnamed protein product [Caenorhabditis angaria]